MRIWRWLLLVGSAFFGQSSGQPVQTPWGIVGLGILAMMTLMTHWSHLYAFEQEASEFEFVAGDGAWLAPCTRESGYLWSDFSHRPLRALCWIHSDSKRRTFITTGFLVRNIPLSMAENTERFIRRSPLNFAFRLCDPVHSICPLNRTRWYTMRWHVRTGMTIPPSDQFPFQLIYRRGGAGNCMNGWKSTRSVIL